MEPTHPLRRLDLTGKPLPELRVLLPSATQTPVPAAAGADHEKLNDYSRNIYTKESRIATDS